MLLLTLLPLAGLAQTVEWVGGSAPDITYGDATDFPSLVSVVSASGSHTCTSLGEGTSYPTGNNNQYRWKIFKGSSQVDGSDPTKIDAGEYTLRLYIRHQTSGGWSPSYGNATRDLSFTIKKKDVTVSLYQVVREWHAPAYWNDLDVDQFGAVTTAYTVDGATWNDIKSSLSWVQLQTIENVGSYKYTFEVTSAPANYNVHINATAADLKVEKADADFTVVATNGDNLTYDGTEQTLEPKVKPVFADGDDVVAGTIEYSLDGIAWSTDYPKGKDADTYTVKYRGVGDINHNDAPGAPKTYDVTIDPYELVAGTDFTAPTAKTGLVYNEADQEIATAGAFIGKFAAELEAAGAKFQYPTDNLPTEINVGTYDFIWKIDLGTSTNFTYPSAYATVNGATIVEATITDADVTAPVGATDLKYILDTPQQLIKTGAVVATDNGKGAPKGVVYYSVDGGTWTDDLTKVTGEHVKASEGKYVISWYIKGNGNYVDYGSETTPAGTVEVGIAPIQYDLATTPTAATGLIYNGADQSILASGITRNTTTSPKGAIEYYIDGGAAIDGSAFANVKAKDAGEYTVTWKVVPADAAYENDYIAAETAPGKEVVVTIDKKEVIVGGNTVSGTIEDLYDLTTLPAPTAKYAIAEFLKDVKVLAVDNAIRDAILNEIVKATVPAFENLKAGNNSVTFTAVDDAENSTNYRANVLGAQGNLAISTIEAAIQEDAEPKLGMIYNGEDQELIGKEAVGYKAPAGTGSKAIGKVVYSLEEAGEYTDDVTKIVGKDADKYTVYYKVELDEENTETFDRFYTYTAAVKSFTATIDQKPLDLAMFEFDPESQTAVYNGSNQLPVITTVAAEPITTDDWYFEFADGKGNPIANPNEGVKNVDVYAVTLKAETDGNYKGEVPTTWEITPKAITADMFTFSADVEYTGVAQQPEITAKDGELDLVEGTDYEFTVKDGEGNDVAFDNMVDASTYTFEFTGKGNYMNLLPAPTKTWTIGKKALTADMFVLSEGVTFNGEAQKPTITTKTGEPIVAADYTFDITVADQDKLFDYDTELIDADTYTFTFKATADGNYSSNAQVDWTIAQAIAKIVEPTKINLTYNNTDQLLVTEGTTDAVAGSEKEPAGKVEYQVTSAFENKVIVEWTDDYSKVVALNADEYTIDYRITASEKNYTNPLVEGSISNEILKAKVAYMLSNLEKTWDGETFTDEEVATVFTLYTGELFGDDKYDVPFTLTLPEDYKDAGTYSFKQAKYEFKEGKRENYKVNFTGEANIVINKADIVAEDFEAPEPMIGMIFNGEDKELVSKGEVITKYEDEPIGVILFSTTENGEYSTAVPTGKNAGAYEVWYYVKGDKNHNDTKAVKLEAGIMPRNWDAVLAFEDAIGEDALTYNTKDQMPDTELKDGETVLEKGKDYTLVIEYTPANNELQEMVKPELVNAGKYDFTYTGINNYEGAEVKRTIVINPADLADVAVVTINGELIKDYEPASVKYTSKDQKPNLGLRYEGAILAAETDYEVAAEAEMINAGEYEFTFTAVAGGNYKGETTATFTVTPLEVIVEAADATKVYDGEEGFDELPELTFNGVLENEIALVDEIFDFDATAFTFAKTAKNVGTYAFEVVPEEITATNYEVTGANGANFTITPAPLVVEWNDEAEPFTKVYGAADPDLIATAENVDVTGAVNAEEEEAIINLTKITRAEGEAVGKYAVTLSAKPAVNSVFANYEVEKAFPNNKGKEAFVITEATVKVSIAALEKVYDGEAATIEVTAEDLVVTGLKNGDKKEDIFSELPTATVADGKAVTVGTYQVTLAGGKAADYVIELIPSTFDIVPATITTATIASQQIKKGQDVEENIDATAFTIEGVIAADADKFYVTVNDKYQDFDGKVSAAKGIYNDGLVIAVDDEVADNYTGYDKFFGELRVLPAEAMVIADNEDWTTEAKHAEAVTFTDRAINAGNWNVVALPFATTVKQVSDAFGYAAVDVLNETASDGSIHFQVISSGIIPAYTPFIVKTTEDEDLLKDNFNQVVFEDVDLEPWTKAENSEVKDAANNKFIGTFKALTEIPAGSKAHWYMSKGTWYDTANRTKAVNLKAFRAYVEFDPANVAAGARIYIEEPDGTETSIDAIEFNQMVNGDNTYTVDGKKVSNTAQKGVYIQNGKKVAVK